MEPFRTELVVFDERLRIAGSIDMLYRDPQTDELWIYDWKRSKEFKHSNKWQSGIGILGHLDDCNIAHYSLQLNLYEHILKTHYNVKIAGKCLVRCHPNLSTYERFVVPDMSHEISMILDNRYKELYGTNNIPQTVNNTPESEDEDECAFSDSD